MDVDYSPTGREFVAAGYDRSVRIYAYNGGHSHEVYTAKRMQRVFTARFTGDGSYVVSGSDDFNLRVWKVRARVCACVCVCARARARRVRACVCVKVRARATFHAPRRLQCCMRRVWKARARASVGSDAADHSFSSAAASAAESRISRAESL